MGAHQESGFLKLDRVIVDSDVGGHALFPEGDGRDEGVCGGVEELDIRFGAEDGGGVGFDAVDFVFGAVEDFFAVTAGKAFVVEIEGTFRWGLWGGCVAW